LKEIHQSDGFLLDDVNGKKRQTYYRNAVETIGNKAYPKYKLLQNVKNDIKELQEEYRKFNEKIDHMYALYEQNMNKLFDLYKAHNKVKDLKKQEKELTMFLYKFIENCVRELEYNNIIHDKQKLEEIIENVFEKTENNL
jgi:DNA repair ATPase RecN